MSEKLSKSDRISEAEKSLKRMRTEYADTGQIMNDLGQKRIQLEKNIKSVENQLASLRPPNLTVSDHAVLRYAQRRYDFPFDKVKSEIEAMLKGANDLGTLKVQGFVVKNNVVTTYLPQKSSET